MGTNNPSGSLQIADKAMDYGAQEHRPVNIHQMWYDREDWDSPSEPPHVPASKPGIYRRYSETWRAHNPRYTYHFWNRRSVHALIDTHPLLAPYREFFHRGITRHIEKCDFARYCIMYTLPGFHIWCDLDFVCTRNWDSLLRGRSLVFCEEPREHNVYWLSVGESNTKRLVYNGVFASEGGHPMWTALLPYIVRNYSPDKDVLRNSGPAMLAEFFDTHPHVTQGALVPSALLLPLNSRGQLNSELLRRPDLADQAYAYTTWDQGTGW